MPSTYSANLRLELIASGEQGNTWGNTTNNNLGSLLEQAITGATEITSLPATLTALNGASDQSRSMYLYVNAPTGGNIIAPATPKMYIVKNNTTDSTNVIIKTSSSTGITIPGGASKVVYYSAATSDFVEAVTAASAMYLSSAISADTQATTKLYVDTADTALLPRNGTRNMTGELILSSGSQPSNSLAAVSKQYVNSFDISVANTSGNTSAASGLIKAGSFSGGNLALTLAPATATNLGGVKPNSTQFSVALDGAMTLNPPAGGLIGGVKAGTNITIAGDGTISASGGASGITTVNATSPIQSSTVGGTVSLSMIANAYYPYTGNPSGFLTTITSAQVTSALGYTPASTSSLSGYLPLSGGTVSGDLTVTSSTGITANRPGVSKSLITGVLYYSSVSNYYPSIIAVDSGSSSYANLGFAQRNNAGTDNLMMYFGNTGNANFLFNVVAGGTLTSGSLGTGAVYSSAGVLTNTSPSDERLKDNIADINYGLPEILQLRPVNFTWKNDKTPTLAWGFVAQEVAPVMPDVVTVFEQDEKEYFGVDAVGINVTLVKAIQELNAKVESLSAEVKALKGE